MATNTKQSSQTSACQTSDEPDVVQNVVGTSRKKMKRGTSDTDSQVLIENKEEYRMVNLNCLSTAVSNIEHVCGQGI